MCVVRAVSGQTGSWPCELNLTRKGCHSFRLCVECVSPVRSIFITYHGAEETSCIAQEVGPQEEIGKAPQEVEKAQQQEGGPQASQVPQEEEELQEGLGDTCTCRWGQCC